MSLLQWLEIFSWQIENRWP